MLTTRPRCGPSWPARASTGWPPLSNSSCKTTARRYSPGSSSPPGQPSWNATPDHPRIVSQPPARQITTADLWPPDPWSAGEMMREVQRTLDDWLIQLLRDLRVRGCLCRPCGTERDDGTPSGWTLWNLVFTIHPACPVHQPAEEAAMTSPYPKRITCPSCDRPILVVLNRRSGDVPLAFDPEPDRDGEHFDTILSDDLSYVSASGETIAEDCKGRFPLYRSHYWTCPNRMGMPRPSGQAAKASTAAPLAIGGYWYREDS